MRNASGNIAIGTGVALVAGTLTIAMPASALASQAAPPSPRAEAPAISGAEIRSDAVVQRPDPSVLETVEIGQEMDAIVACSAVPPMVEEADARPARPARAAGRVGNAGARVAK